MSQEMPKAEVDLPLTTVADLIVRQFPRLSGQELTPVGEGWDNFMFRVGRDHVARFPRRELSAPMIENEGRWLPVLADRLTLPIPAPIFVGQPDLGFPWRWLLAPWIEGTQLARAASVDVGLCCGQLGLFLRSLHEPAPEEAPDNPWRGMHVAERDEVTRERIANVAANEAERDRLMSIWEEVVGAPPHDGPPVWLHGDLHPANVLTVDGQVSGVIDFTDLTSGDPATDLSIAWMIPGADPEAVFAAYGRRDHSLISRARGWALALGVTYIDHGRDNATMTQVGRDTVRSLLDEPQG